MTDRLHGETDFSRWEEIAPWSRKLAARGWFAPAWPVEHGGMGLGLPGSKRLVHDFELRSAPGHGTCVTITRWK